MIRLRRLFLRLRREQRGAVALTYLLCFPLILFMLLGAIDFIRYGMAQGKLQNALDAAVISAGRNLDKYTPRAGSDQEAGWRADAISYFRSNMPEDFLGSRIPSDNLTITYDEEKTAQGAASGQLVRMSASGSLPLLIAGTLDRTAFNLSAANEAVRRTRGDLEMVLALDNTGSMQNENRIGKLKSAATELVDTVLGAARGGETASQTFIGIVPFADTVYIGAQKTHWLTPEARQFPYIAAGKHWGGCVVEPYLNNIFAAEAGLPGSFAPLMTVGTLNGNNGLITTAELKSRYERQHGAAVYGYRVEPGSVPLISGDRSMRADLNAEGDIVPRFAFNSYYEQTQYGFVRNNNCPSSREMMFLTDNAARLKQKISAMAVDGRTIIPLGLLWSWRMLDPAWRGEQGWEDNDKPRDAAIGLNKVIVLLTDGNNGLDPKLAKSDSQSIGVVIDGERDIAVDYGIRFNYQIKEQEDSSWSKARSDSYADNINQLNDDNHYFTFSKYANSSDFNSLRVGDKDELNNNGTAINPYGKLYQARINGQSDWEVGNNTLNALTNDLCKNIKTADIKIYTVVLGSGTNGTTKTMMQNCSSGAGGYYFDASNVNDLSAAFAAIAGSLTELRLNK
ncbi:TadE/TadG family type IV pilus assembly protein [Brenneria corticis]|uniref:Putative Flp pilus-assembly TadG-like N-terminal domain-containing protein n=1 Tax=Brenneria corticis TaxID=2173106 RepID=A0A2U1U7P3_9GAMM|nr:TadE/TadG family type IV pilus assembly protein [Brenneria sp. CFCC 11842]PWC17688.1 hypothetical protein DDT56_05370 [Brenneria sp. CFCC 11842]